MIEPVLAFGELPVLSFHNMDTSTYHYPQTSTPFYPSTFILENPHNNYRCTTSSMASGQKSNTASPKSSSARTDSTANGRDGRSRLRKACDSCSIRKVKCDEGGPPCQACAALDIPCTFERPSRRRGPPNRHAEILKKKGPGLLSNGRSASTTPAAATTITDLSCESICSLGVLELLVDDYFTYCHPLIPLPHEPTFREALKNREDKHNPTFLALLASMISCLASACPRQPRSRLKNAGEHEKYPTMIRLVEGCHRIALEARGIGFFDKEHSVYDASTSYLLGVSCIYTYKWRQTKLYWNEGISILRNLGIRRSFKTREAHYFPDSNPHYMATEDKEDLITREMGRRTFWCLFNASRIVLQLGGNGQDAFIPPETFVTPYPPLPLEVDDSCILPDRILPQPFGKVPIMTGYNASIRLHRSYESLAVLDIAYGTESPVQWQQQIQFIRQSLNTCREVIDNLPKELQINQNLQQQQQSSQRFQDGPAWHVYDGQKAGEKDPYYSESRRTTQLEIQKAYIYVSQLATRFHMTEKLAFLTDRRVSRHTPFMLQHPQNIHNSRMSVNSPQPGQDTQFPPPIDTTSPVSPDQDWIDCERRNIVQDLLAVLQSVDPFLTEAHGLSLVFKIRMIASSLLETPMSSRTPLDPQADQYLATFLDILMRLERTVPAGQSDRSSMNSSPSAASDGDMSVKLEDQDAEDEEAELRHWTDLRDHQARFIHLGSFFE